MHSRRDFLVLVPLGAALCAALPAPGRATPPAMPPAIPLTAAGTVMLDGWVLTPADLDLIGRHAP